MKLLLAASLALLAACPSPHGNFKPPAPMPSVQDVVARLAKEREARKTFSAASTMDYWLGKDRVKGDVMVMGTDKRQVRFNGLDPTGGVLADMACNGSDYVFVDMKNNCQRSGPCNRDSIAQLLRVELEPDDFLHLALGTPPVIDQASGTVTWDSNKGYERVQLEGPAGKQSIVIDARDGRWDVVASELVGRDGKIVWSVENADFVAVKDESGVEHRLPGKTRFKSPQQQQDLLVDWKERRVNLAIDPAKFTVPVPQGLPGC